MLEFLKKNDSSVWLISFGVMLIMHLPMWIGASTLWVQELRVEILAQKISSGAIMYTDIWDNYPPVSTRIYASLLSIIGGKVEYLRWFAFAFIPLQAFLIQSVLRDRGILPDKNYLFIFLYVVVGSTLVEQHTVSTLWIAQTFLILTIRQLFLFEGEIKEHDIYLTGLWFGFAVLSHTPYFFMLPFLVISVIVLGSFTLRNFIIALIGALFPILILFIYYYFKGGLVDFFNNYLLSFYYTSTSDWNFNLLPILLLSLPIWFFMLLASYYVFAEAGYTNYQRTYQQLTLVYLICWSFTVVASDTTSLSFLIGAAFPVAFIGALYVSRLKVRRWKKYLPFPLFLVWLFWPIGMELNAIHPTLSEYYKAHSSHIQEVPLEITNKKLLVLSSNISWYEMNSCPTPYLNWSLSESRFTDPKYLNYVMEVYHQLLSNKVDIIIDPDAQMRNIFERVPILKNKYTLKAGYSYIYERTYE